MKIFEAPEEREYWAVRTDGGLYYDHFTKYGIISLGHLDILNIPETGNNIFTPDFTDLSLKLQNKYKSIHRKKGTATSHINQIKRFVRDIKIGDWVLAIGRNRVCFGRVTGFPKITRTALSVSYGKNQQRKIEMPHNLRRTVNWGPEIDRYSLPFGILSSMRAYQSIFNINQHRELICHTLYPVFKQSDALHFSINIKSKAKINNYQLTCLLNYLNELEFISKKYDDIEIFKNFENLFEIHANSHEITTSIKAHFQSPGDLWTNVKSFSKGTKYLILGYILLFGNHQLGFDGIIDLDTRHKIRDIIIERYNQNNLEEISSSLALSMPNYDTSLLESIEHDEIDAKTP